MKCICPRYDECTARKVCSHAFDHEQGEDCRVVRDIEVLRTKNIMISHTCPVCEYVPYNISVRLRRRYKKALKPKSKKTRPLLW